MIQFWILKYILYNTFTKRNLVAAYYEGSSFGLLLAFPILSVLLLLFHKINFLFGIILAITLTAFNIYITWDDEKVFRKYRDIEMNRDKLNTQFKQVYWFIVLDLSFFVFTLIYFINMKR